MENCDCGSIEKDDDGLPRSSNDSALRPKIERKNENGRMEKTTPRHSYRKERPMKSSNPPMREEGTYARGAGPTSKVRHVSDAASSLSPSRRRKNKTKKANQKKRQSEGEEEENKSGRRTSASSLPTTSATAYVAPHTSPGRRLFEPMPWAICVEESEWYVMSPPPSPLTTLEAPTALSSSLASPSRPVDISTALVMSNRPERTVRAVQTFLLHRGKQTG